MEEGENRLPAIPAKRYFTIGEVSELCGVKPYVLRYWEQEFAQLKPVKRRGNRRYYQHHEVLLIRRIRDLLYDQGFTISGARNRLADGPAAAEAPKDLAVEHEPREAPAHPIAVSQVGARAQTAGGTTLPRPNTVSLLPEHPNAAQVRDELVAIRELLSV
jgi:DNA-binding transcriptional MerR regulator